MRLGKWLGIEKTKKPKRKEESSGPDAYRRELRRRRRDLRANGKHVEPNTKEIDGLKRQISELSDELKEVNRESQRFNRQQLTLMNRNKTGRSGSSPAVVFRRGLKAMSAKPISKDEMRTKMFGNEYWNRTAPPRRRPPTRGG